MLYCLAVVAPQRGKWFVHDDHVGVIPEGPAPFLIVEAGSVGDPTDDISVTLVDGPADRLGDGSGAGSAEADDALVQGCGVERRAQLAGF